MDFIDLKSQQKRIRKEVEQRLHSILDHGRYIGGPEIKELEENLASFVGTKFSLGCASGTDALLLSLMALEIGPGDEVITTPFSFFATTEVISLLGAKLVFADIDPKTYNLDANKIEALITSKTKAIMPVSLYGQPANFKDINEIASRKNIPVIEDGAQSFGALHHGKPSCGLTTIGATSFFPSKPLGAYGDAGACFTNDEELAKKIRQCIQHGEASRYNHVRIGLCSRIDSFQAAILLEKLKIFPDEVVRRQEVGSRYIEALSSSVRTPVIESHNTSVFAQFTIEVEDRENFISRMHDLEVPTAVHYPVPLHAQPVYRDLGFKIGDFPHAEAAANRVVSLPMHPYLSQEDQNKVVEAVKKSVQ